MPLIGAITGGLDFSNYYTALSSKVQPGLSYADAKKQGAVLGWGQFLTVAINFLIIAWVLFLAIKGINKLKKEEPPVPAPGPTTIRVLRSCLLNFRCAVVCEVAHPNRNFQSAQLSLPMQSRRNSSRP